MRILLRVLAVLAVLALVLLGGSLLLRERETPVIPDEPPDEPTTEQPEPEDEPPDDPTPIVEPNEEDEVTQGEQTPDEVDGLPVGKLVITPERRDYEDGALTLRIPRLSVVRTVYDGTGSDQLRLGVGLFDYAQLPGEGNRNVSLAGHRNGRRNGVVNDHAPFYYIDTLSEGDYLYLDDGETIYRYLYELTDIVASDDWSYIKTTGESVLTLTSCHPIGSTSERIIVRGTLDAVLPYEGNDAFPASEEELLP